MKGKRKLLKMLVICSLLIFVGQGKVSDASLFQRRPEPTETITFRDTVALLCITHRDVIAEKTEMAIRYYIAYQRMYELTRLTIKAGAAVQSQVKAYTKLYACATESSAYHKMLEMVKEFEGYDKVAKIGMDGRVTVGYGFTRCDIPDLEVGDVMSRSKADRMLGKLLLEHYARMVDECVKVQLRPHQRAALISFVYNVGQDTFRKSDVLYMVNRKRFDDVGDELLSYNRCKGRRLKGLSIRRRAEGKLFDGE